MFGQLDAVLGNCAQRNPQGDSADFPSDTPITPHVVHSFIHRLC
jgi:hypothetical protein